MADDTHPDREDIFDEARDVIEDSRRLADDMGKVYERVRETASIREIYDKNPYAVLASAAGVGYVLGGGLLTPFTKRMTKIGMKALIVPFALSRLKGLTQAAVPPSEGE